MGIRNRTILTISSLVLIFILVASYVSNIIILQGFINVEQERTIVTTQRVIRAFNVDKENLDYKLADWSIWDDSYAFVQDHNPQFIEKNLLPLALESLKLNVLIYVNTDGAVVIAKGFNLIDGREETISPNILTQIYPGSPILSTNDQDTKTGLLATPEGPLLFAARPILATNGEGPFKGTIIFGKYMDHSQIAKLGEVTKVKLEGYYLPTDSVPRDVEVKKDEILKDMNKVVTNPLTEKEIASYFYIPTITETPGLLFRITTNRDIYTLGKQNGVFITLLLLFLGGCSITTIIIILEWSVLSPLFRINKEIQRIQTNPNSTEPISTKGLHSEFLELSKSINTMITSLQENQQEILQHKEELENMNSSMIGRELKMKELKEKIAALEKQLADKV